jgi:hypothetical protein
LVQQPGHKYGTKKTLLNKSVRLSNWTDNKEEYIKIFAKKTLAPMMENIEHTIENWFEFDGKKLRFKTENVDIDKWFMETNMSNQLRKEYIDYRLEYAWINLNK